MHSPKIGQAALRSRRGVFEIAAAAGLAIAIFFAVLGDPAAPALAEGSGVTLDALMAGEALPDVAFGASNAPVTIVEYASMTCPHCAAFYATTFPELKRKYIDTGKVRFILREFPRDPFDTAGFMLARCSGDDKRNAVVDLLFAQQKNWLVPDKALDALATLLKQTGMSQKTFDACLENDDLRDKVYKVHDRAAEKFGVTSTPTFFVNGKKKNAEEMTSEALEKLLGPLLKG